MQLNFSKSGEPPLGRDEENRGKGPSSDRYLMDTDTLTGNRAMQQTDWPNGRETAADDSDLSREPNVFHNRNHPVIGVHKAKRKSNKPQSMYTQPLTDEATGMSTEQSQLSKSNDATPGIDPDSVPESQDPVDSPSETPNDPRSYLEHVDPEITQTSHASRIASPGATGMQWADWPSGVTNQ